METPESITGSKDGQGSGDRDTAYAWGSPRVYLTPWQQAHLLVMRGKVIDARGGISGGPADGDIDYVSARPSGLLLVDHSRP